MPRVIDWQEDAGEEDDTFLRELNAKRLKRKQRSRLVRRLIVANILAAIFAGITIPLACNQVTRFREQQEELKGKLKRQPP